MKPSCVSFLSFDSLPPPPPSSCCSSFLCLLSALYCVLSFFLIFFVHPLASSLLIAWTVWCPLWLPAMADSSFVTLGTARSLLVDSSVCDSRLAETTKEHLFLGLACEDGQSTPGLCSLRVPGPPITSPKYSQSLLKTK